MDMDRDRDEDGDGDEDGLGYEEGRAPGLETRVSSPRYVFCFIFFSFFTNCQLQAPPLPPPTLGMAKGASRRVSDAS